MTLHDKHSIRTAVVVCAAALLLVFTAAAAYAAPTGPESIVKYGFENSTTDTLPDRLPSAGVPGDAVTDSYWGAIAGVSHAGTQSLWCAGTAVAPNPTPTYAGGYTSGTRGTARVRLSQLADYYSAYVTCYYRMESIGGGDQFQLDWKTYEGTSSYGRHPVDAVASGWTQVPMVNLTDGYPEFSRRAADVGVLFWNETPGYGEAATGKGPAVDDFEVLGYKYGPVRNLAVVAGTGDQASLSWSIPYRAVGSASTESRTLSYRVWRAPMGSPMGSDIWTELTSDTSRLTGTSFIDVTPVPGQMYSYAVQAWDTGTGAGRGEISQVDWKPASAITVTAPSAPTGQLSVNQQYTSSGSVLPAHASGAAVEIQCSQQTDGAGITKTVAATIGSDGSTYSAPLSFPTAGTWHVRAKYSDATHPEIISGWLTVAVDSGTVILPLATLAAPSAPSLARTWRSFTSVGTISPAHADGATVWIECSKDMSTILKTFTGGTAAGGTDYSASVSLTQSGTWYIRAHHADSTHRDSYSGWTTVKVSSAVILGAPKPRTTMSVNHTYAVSGTMQPRHTSATYLRVLAYKWSSSTRKYVYKKTFSVRISNTGQPANTTKYTASVKLTQKGYWKLKAKHYAHGVEGTTYSALSTRVTVK